MSSSALPTDLMQQFKENLSVAYQHHLAHNYIVSVPICQTLLKNVLPPIMEAECHIMLTTAPIPEALDHSISANIIVRELLDHFPEDEQIQELYHISQVLLRMKQDETREEREQPTPPQQSHTSADNFAGAASRTPSNSPTKQRGDNDGSSTIPPSPSRGHRRRLSDINSSLTSIPEEPCTEPAAPSTPSKPVYRNRRPSSLGRAARTLAFGVRSTQGI